MKRSLLWMLVGVALLFLPEWPCEYDEKSGEKEDIYKRKA